MKYFTEEWYRKFYGTSPYALADNPALNDELMRTSRDIGKALQADMAGLPRNSAYTKCDLHDACVEKIELVSKNLIMHLDTAMCYCSFSKLTFTNVEFKNVPEDYLTKTKLDWFQDEVTYLNGKYHVGILFTDRECWLPYSKDYVSPKKLPESWTPNPDFPAPYIMEFSAENVIIE